MASVAAGGDIGTDGARYIVDGHGLEPHSAGTGEHGVEQALAAEEDVLRSVHLLDIHMDTGLKSCHIAGVDHDALTGLEVFDKGLDIGTAYEILSIDIADVDVGRNIGAQLQMDQAEADKRVAQAKAEERRALAIAEEQEMKAKTQEMRALVISAEAEVPKALAEALKNGKMGVMDYYNMLNLQADTAMRNTISGESAPQNSDN